jgi:serine/threonine protein kinase
MFFPKTQVSLYPHNFKLLSVRYCINPWCRKRENDDTADHCAGCDSPLLINERFRVIKPLFDLNRTHETDIYEVLDLTGSWISPPNSIKILKVLKAFDPQEFFLDRLKLEAETLQTLNHPGIPRCDLDDFFHIYLEKGPDELYCLAIEKIEGMTMDEYIHCHGRIDQNLAIAWLKQLAEILDYVHSKKIIHRDIKPSNIIVRPDRSLVLIDFGGARHTTSTYYAKIAPFSPDLVTRIHTIGYTAPEQMNGKAIPQSDFFSLGKTFINALTGKEFSDLSYDEETGNLLWQQHAQQIDPPIRRFIERLTSSAIARRPIHTQEILSFLNDELPIQLKWYQFFRSKQVRFGSLLLAGLIVFSSLHFAQLMIADNFSVTGLRQLTSNQLAEARTSLERSIALHPTAEAYTNLGLLCDRTQQKECALDSYNKAIQLNPKSYPAFYNLGFHYEEQGDYPRAIATYQKAIALSQNNAPEPLNNLARLLILQRQDTAAKELIEKALKTTKEDYFRAILSKNLGWILFNQQKYAESQAILNQSIALEPNLASSHCLLAQVKEAQKQPAKEEWQKCLSIQSEDSASPEVIQWRSILINRALSLI